MIGQREWIKSMALSHLVGVFAFVLLLVNQGSTLTCGWPGKPIGGSLMSSSLPMPVKDEMSFGRAYVPSNRMISNEYQFQEGQVVAYQCRTDRLDVIRGGSGNNFNRTCQSDGRWSGTRPWCDLNVAFGKNVNYAGVESTRTDMLMTDGLTDSEDPSNTAECATLTKTGGAYLKIDLGENLPVRVVGIFGKGGEGMVNLNNKKVTVGTSNCPQMAQNSSAFGYQCNREQTQVYSGDTKASSVLFEHSSNFTVDICEVVVYANPTLSDCGEPEIPAFGEVEITTNTTFQEAKYRCRVGYELQGRDSRLCYGRNWEGVQPICVELLVTTTTEGPRDLTDPFDGGNSGGGMDPFQIVLIVVCVSLAIGLIVALVVLLKYGRLTCCGSTSSTISRKLSSKKKPPAQGDYQRVTPAPVQVATPTTITSEEEARKRTAALAAAEQERYAKEQDAINTRLAYQNEMTAQAPKQAPKTAPKPTVAASPSSVVYAELSHEPVRRSPSSPSDTSLSDSLPRADQSPVYAQVVNMRTSKIANDENSSSNGIDTPPVRKSYIPSVYLKESPEVQMKQQALNDQLKQAVKITRNTDF